MSASPNSHRLPTASQHQTKEYSTIRLKKSQKISELEKIYRTEEVETVALNKNTKSKNKRQCSTECHKFTKTTVKTFSKEKLEYN